MCAQPVRRRVPALIDPNHADYRPRQLRAEEIPWMLHRNIWTGVLGELFYIYLTSGIYFTAFCQAMGMQDYQFGVLGALVALSTALMLFASLIEVKFGGRKYPWFVLSGISRACFFPFVLGFFVPLNPWLIIALYVFGMALARLGEPLWFSWVYGYVPSEMMGRFWARRSFWAVVGSCSFGLSAAILIRALPDEYTMQVITAAFALLIVGGMVDLYFHRQIPEGPRTATEHGALAKALATFKNASFRRWMIAVCSWSFAVCVSGPFCLPYMMKDLGFREDFLGAAVLVTILPAAGSLMTLRLWGKAADRWDPAKLVVVCYAVWASLPLFYWLADGPHTFLLLAVCWALAGVFPRAVFVLSSVLTPRLAGEDRTMPVAMLAVMASVGGACGSLVGTVIVKNFGIVQVFPASLVARYLAVFVVFFLIVYLPRRSRARASRPAEEVSPQHGCRNHFDSSAPKD